MSKTMDTLRKKAAALQESGVWEPAKKDNTPPSTGFDGTAASYRDLVKTPNVQIRTKMNDFSYENWQKGIEELYKDPESARPGTQQYERAQELMAQADDARHYMKHNSSRYENPNDALAMQRSYERAASSAVDFYKPNVPAPHVAPRYALLATLTDEDEAMDYLRQISPTAAAHREETRKALEAAKKDMSRTVSGVYGMLATLETEEEVNEYLNSIGASALASDRKHLSELVEHNRGQSRTVQQINIMNSAMSDDYKIQAIAAYDPALAQKLYGMSEDERKEEYRRQYQYGLMSLDEYEEALFKAEQNFYSYYTNHYDPLDPASVAEYEKLSAEHTWLLDNKDKAWMRSNDIKYSALTKNEDFAKKSATDYSNRDPMYMYINNIGRGQDQEENYDVYLRYGEGAASSGNPSTALYEKYKDMTDEEVAMYNYLYSTEGKDAANEYLTFAEYAINARNTAQTREDAANAANKNLVGASLDAVGKGMISGIGFLDAVVQKAGQVTSELFGGGIAAPVDYNTAAMQPSVYESTVLQVGAENINKKYGMISSNEEDRGKPGVFFIDEKKNPLMARIFNGKGWGDVYQGGMSVLNSWAGAGLSWLVPGLGLFAMSGSASTRVLLNTIEKGGSDTQAIAMGFLAGLAEYAMERFPMENLLHGDWTGNRLGSFIRQTLPEGLEEGGTSIINWAADVLIMARDSDYREAIDAYIDNGMDEKKAKWRAFGDKVIEIGWDVAGGIATGSTSGSVRLGLQTVVDAKNIGTLKKSASIDTYRAITPSLVTRVLAETPNDKTALSIRAQMNAGGIESVKANDIYRLILKNGDTVKQMLSSAAQVLQESSAIVEKAEAMPVSVIRSAIDQVKAGTATNKTFEKILDAAKTDPDIQAELKKLGVDITAEGGMTNAQKRDAVKTAIKGVAVQESESEAKAAAEAIQAPSSQTDAPVVLSDNGVSDPEVQQKRIDVDTAESVPTPDGGTMVDTKADAVRETRNPAPRAMPAGETKAPAEAAPTTEGNKTLEKEPEQEYNDGEIADNQDVISYEEFRDIYFAGDDLASEDEAKEAYEQFISLTDDFSWDNRSWMMGSEELTFPKFRQLMRQTEGAKNLTEAELHKLFQLGLEQANSPAQRRYQVQDQRDVSATQEVEETLVEVNTTVNTPWWKQIDDLHTSDPRSALYIRETPNLLAEIGLGDLPLCMTKRHMKNVMAEEDPNHPERHGISEQVVKRLPELLSKPVMILDSFTIPGDVVVVTSEIDAKGRPIVVTIHPNGAAFVDGQKGPANFITSIYGRENFAPKASQPSRNNFMFLALKNRAILYWSKEKSETLRQALGVQFPSGLNSVRSDEIIRQHRGYVKSNIPTRVFSVIKEDLNDRGNQETGTEEVDTERSVGHDRGQQRSDDQRPVDSGSRESDSVARGAGESMGQDGSAVRTGAREEVHQGKGSQQDSVPGDLERDSGSRVQADQGSDGDRRQRQGDSDVSGQRRAGEDLHVEGVSDGDRSGAGKGSDGAVLPAQSVRTEEADSGDAGRTGSVSEGAESLRRSDSSDVASEAVRKEADGQPNSGRESTDGRGASDKAQSENPAEKGVKKVKNTASLFRAWRKLLHKEATSWETLYELINDPHPHQGPYAFKNLGQGIIVFDEPPHVALRDSGEIQIGVVRDGEARWIWRYDVDDDGLALCIDDLPKLLSDAGVVAPDAWLDRSHTIEYDGEEYRAIPAAESESKAHRDLQKQLDRVGYTAYVLDAGSIAVKDKESGRTVAHAAGVTEYDGKLYIIGNKNTGDHESLHAFMHADPSLYFRIRDAVVAAVPDTVFSELRERARDKWKCEAGSDLEDMYVHESEVFCEAYSGSTRNLGPQVTKLSAVVRRAVREWQAEWDAKGVDPSKIKYRPLDVWELTAEFEKRGLDVSSLTEAMENIEAGYYDDYYGASFQVAPDAGSQSNSQTEATSVSPTPAQAPDLSDFVKRFNEQYGEGAAESMFKNLQQLQRAERRMTNRVAAARASTQAQKTLAEQRQKDMATAWIMYHKRTTRAIHQSYAEKIREIKAAERAKADTAVREARAEERAVAAVKLKDAKAAAHAEKVAAVQQARKAEADKGKQKLEDQKMAERMNAKRMAGKRLGVKDREITELKNDSLERAQIRRNASRAAIRNKNLSEKKRAEAEVKNGPIDTIRKNPAERTFVQRLQESANALRTAGRSLYRAFTSETEALERFAKRQKSGSLATTHVTVAGAASTTTERILREGLVARNGDTLGESMKDVFLCLDKKGRVDEAMQALLQDYMLHLHNVDRMSIVDNALKALQEFEAKNPWLRDMPGKELGRLTALTDTEAKALGKERARETAQKYSRLMQEYSEAENKPVFPDGNGKAISAAASREIVDKYEAENPWLKDKAQGIYDWWDAFMLEWVVGESLTLDAYHSMKKLYPHYVPTYRVDKGGLQSGGANASALTPGRVVKRAKGSLREIVNIEESFASLVAKSVKVARTNALYRNVVDTLLLDDGVGDFADMGYFDFDSLSTGSYYLDMLGRQTETHVPGMEPDVGIENSELAGLVKVGNDYRVSAWYDGELLSAYVSEDVFNALSAVAGASDGKFKQTLIKVGNMLTGPMKTAITGINPNFALRNLSRDLPTAIINSCSGLAFPKYWAQAGLDMAAAGLLSNEQLANILKVVNVDTSKMKGSAARYDTFRNLGGTHANYYNNNSGFAASISKGRNVLSKAVDAMGAFNEATEAMTRYAEYIATVERLGDTYENRLKGIKNSAEVTVDFSRSGSWGKVINAWVPYWNPAVQGIDKVFRSLVESPDGSAWYKQTLKTLGRAAMTTVVVEALLMVVLSALGRRDEWEKLSDRTKDTYYCIPLKDEHKFLRIPKNREWGAILGTPFSRLWEAANGREDPFENYLEVSITPNFLPPTLLDAIGVSQAIDIAANKDFKGSPIVPYAYQNGTISGQYDNDTSVAARWLSKVLGEKLSPMQIDYIISDYFGDFGDMAIQLLAPGTYGEGSATDVAQGLLDVVLSPWVSDMRYSNHDVSKYYEVVESLERGYEDIRNHNSDPDAYKSSFEYLTFKAVEELYGKEITELNKSARTLPDGDEKDAIKEEIARLASEALSFYEDCKNGTYENPKLTAEYWHLPASVSDELIRLNGLAEDYSIAPPSYKPTAYGDPKSKEGNTMTREYVLKDDDEALAYYEALRDQTYADKMVALLESRAYQKATDTEKCELIEELKEEVTEEVKDEFLLWLADNRRSVPKK